MEAHEYFRNRAQMYRRWAADLARGSAEQIRLLASADDFDREAERRELAARLSR